ncbi:MAG: GlsB/YeaQ/YmgE family stress response membrane protein [Verrucomicrobiota bacterium]
MEIRDIIILVVSGGIAGWLAGMILKKGGLNVIGNIVVGVCGAFIGTSLFRMLEIRFGNEYVQALVTATVGAIILLAVLSFLQKKKK